MRTSANLRNVTSSKVLTLLVFSGLVLPCGGLASNQVTEFRSTNGISEKCTIFTEMPGGRYSDGDHQKEKEFCSLDFNNNTMALCPKTWSTSAGVVFYELQNNLNSRDFETQRCSLKSGNNTIAKLKFTMNESDTSATNSKASILYYHFSRLLNVSVKVPVAVKRTMDRRDLYNRVSRLARGQSNMNIAAWTHINTWVRGPYNEMSNPDIFENVNEVYGVILRDKGERYGMEINGVRSHWGAPQNVDFQNTAAFTALRSSSPFLDATREGIRKAQSTPKMAIDLAGTPSNIQMISWMRELTEITLLDYIFSQQDRVGNIDYEWQWIYVQDGVVKNLEIKSKNPRTKMNELLPPAEIANLNPQLIQKTWIGDNDAGAKVEYGNFTKTTKMLEGLRHYNAEVYQRLMALSADLTAHGPIYNYLAQNFKLSSREFQMIVNNTQLASGILKSSCEARRLTFDLNPKKFLLGQPLPELIDCNGN